MTQVDWSAHHEALAASLRLLIEEQGYAMSDVALMFGRSRERVRQWCERYGIAHPRTQGVSVGNRQLRVWDDARHRFVPVNRKAYLAARRRAVWEAACAAVVTRREANRAAIVATYRRLGDELGREPTHQEVWEAFTGRVLPKGRPAGSLLAGIWAAGPIRAGVLAEIRLAAGYPTGAKPRGRGPVTSCPLYCAQGHWMAGDQQYVRPVGRSIQRQCKTCNHAAKRAAYHARRRQALAVSPERE